MTREEEIRQEALKAEKEKFPRCAGDKENSFHGVNSAYGLGFVDGALWADINPKSPWIKVEDDLPCNHEEYINTSDKDGTFYVIALVNDFITLSRMEKDEMGVWHWTTDEPTYWMLIPKLPENKILYNYESFRFSKNFKELP